MKYQALTLKAPGIARSILIPVVVSQAKTLCEKFGFEKIEADVLALIDTGATNTSISNKLAVSLGLKVIEQCEVGAAGGIHIANVYMVDVLLRNVVEFYNIRSAEFIANEKFDIIIGVVYSSLRCNAIHPSGEAAPTCEPTPSGETAPSELRLTPKKKALLSTRRSFNQKSALS